MQTKVKRFSRCFESHGFLLGRSTIKILGTNVRTGDDLHYHRNNTAEETGQLIIAAVYVGGGLEDDGRYYGRSWSSRLHAICELRSRFPDFPYVLYIVVAD